MISKLAFECRKVFSTGHLSFCNFSPSSSMFQFHLLVEHFSPIFSTSIFKNAWSLSSLQKPLRTSSLPSVITRRIRLVATIKCSGGSADQSFYFCIALLHLWKAPQWKMQIKNSRHSIFHPVSIGQQTDTNCSSLLIIVLLLPRCCIVLPGGTSGTTITPPAMCHPSLKPLIPREGSWVNSELLEYIVVEAHHWTYLQR